MADDDQKFDDRLEREIRNHINRYVEKYDAALEKAGGKLDVDLLEYKITTKEGKKNLIIDRGLLADYLSLRVAKSNNALQSSNNSLQKSNNSIQTWVAVFALASAVSAGTQVLILLNLIH